MPAAVSQDALRALLEPRSIAVLGASSDRAKAGGRPIQYLQQLGFQGAVYPINPTRSEIAGLPCYPALSAVPGQVDLCVIAVPEPQVEASLLACAGAGIRAAVVFTSGYAEVGEEGRRRQEQLAELARKHGIALCGPNCLGLINVPLGAAATFTTALERRPAIPPGHVSFVSQSGAIAAFILAVAQDQGKGLRHFITTGNEAVLDFADYACYLLEDSDTRVIAGYLEGIGGEQLGRLARAARERRKPLVLMKVGSSEAGARASAAHTGKLAGVDAVYDAAFQQYGIVRARTVDELLDYSHTLSLCPLPRGPRAGVVSLSGGVAVLMADWCETLGLQVPPPSHQTRERLQQVLPWFATPANPLDTTGRPLWDAGMLQAALEAVASDPAVDMVLVHIGLAPGPTRRIAAEILAAARRSDKPFLVCWLPESEADTQAGLSAAGVPVFTEPVRLVKSAAALAQYSAFLGAPLPGEARPPEARLQLPALPVGPVVSEHAATAFIKAAGVPVTRQLLARSQEEAAAHASHLGFPVCLKVVSPDIPHRTELGAVRLGLSSGAEVVAAFDEILARCQAAVPDARIEGVLVQEMVQGGVELLVSAFRDPVMGPAVLCGLGGVLVEVLRDTAIRLAPVTPAEAEQMLGQLRGVALLRGVRGSPPGDISAAAEAIACLSAAMVAAGPDVETIEINPLIVLPRGQGVRALDGLITRRGADAREVPT